jgi:hypothetical protein
VEDPTPTPVPTSLLVQLIHTINNNTAEVTRLSAKVDQLTKEKRELAVDVACMSKGIVEFKDKFEPYLVDAVDSKKMWQGWRRDWFKMTIGAALICAGGFAMYVVGEVAITWVAQGLAARSHK